MKIPYTKNSHEILEQAAGFPPFTRGYHQYQFIPNIILEDEITAIDFELLNSDSDAILQLFQNLWGQTNLKPIFHLKLNVDCDFQLIVLTRVLRTVLSLLNFHKKGNPEITKFRFSIKNIDTKNILTKYQYLQMSQVDVLCTNIESFFILNSTSKSHLPIDALYGSQKLDTETSILFNKVWDKTSFYFNL